MEIKNIVVKEYLESLTEKNELNYIFPILLEAMGFNILSKPTEYIGIQEYGKDIVAVGIDEDKIKKRFYFELKGGTDRNITEENFYGKDGIQDSLTQASYNEFVSAFPEFENLPLKIVIVHNGVIKGNVQSTLENFFVKTTNSLNNITFERWDISRLTNLFSEKLFGAYLLTDPQSTKLFNRVLVNLNAANEISRDFIELIDSLFKKEVWKKNKKLPRKWQLLFETLKLITFVIYTECKDYNNFEITKRYLTHLILKYWHWILKNKLENDKEVLSYFNEFTIFYFRVLIEYFSRTIPIALLKDGLYSETGGRYEQIGYAKRTFEFLEYYTVVQRVVHLYPENPNIKAVEQQLVKIILANNVCYRPLIDIHSIALINIINFFIDLGSIQNAKNYLKIVLEQLRYAKEKLNFLPDANNSIENVIKLTVTGIKPVYYSDSTSPLLAVLMEYVVLFDMKEEFNVMKEFILKHEIDLGLFVPHHSINSVSKHLISDTENDLEEQLFSKSVKDGYQSELSMTKMIYEDLDYESFKEILSKRKDEFQYEYRTDKAGYSFLKDLAHIYFNTPFFPDKWRNIELDKE
jgi:hypothetical protein